VTEIAGIAGMDSFGDDDIRAGKTCG